jgi:hypothetical protein
VTESKRDPAAVRAVTLVAAPPNNGLFEAPLDVWASEAYPYPSDDSQLDSLTLVNGFQCDHCIQKRPEQTYEQRIQMESSFGLLQDQLLRAADEWNAQVRFWSVVPRDYLTREQSDYDRASGLPLSQTTSLP